MTVGDWATRWVVPDRDFESGGLMANRCGHRAYASIPLQRDAQSRITIIATAVAGSSTSVVNANVTSTTTVVWPAVTRVQTTRATALPIDAEADEGEERQRNARHDVAQLSNETATMPEAARR